MDGWLKCGRVGEELMGGWGLRRSGQLGEYWECEGGMCCRVYGGWLGGWVDGWLKCGQVGEEWMGGWGLRRGGRLGEYWECEGGMCCRVYGG